MDQIREKICAEVEALSDTLFGVSDYLKDNPEIAYQEYKSCNYLSSLIKKHGFAVRKGAGGVETAFVGHPNTI